MTASKAQQKAVQKYVANNYDRVVLTLKKGEKETIQAAAAAVGLSMNKYIVCAIKERLERDGFTPSAEE
jgi:uncharacterized protein (DUF1778 family)